MLSFRRITRQGSSRRIDSGRAQAGVDGGDLTSPRARTSREGGKPTLAAVMVPPGPSPMQVAEADMAREKGVPVLSIDCSALRGEAYDCEQSLRAPCPAQ